MTALAQQTDMFRDHLAAAEQGPAAEALAPVRRQAYEAFLRLGLPTTRHEEWKYTDVSPIARTAFRPAPVDGRAGYDQTRRAFLFGLAPVEIVFVDGRFAPELSTLDRMPASVTVTSLARMLSERPDAVLPLLSRPERDAEHPFVALNTALFADGAVVRVARGVVVESPIHLLFVSTGSGKPTAAHPRTFLLAEENSQADVVESYTGAEGVYLTNAVTDIAAGDNSVVRHYRVQAESLDAFHTSALYAELGRTAVVSTCSISLGGSLVRNDLTARLGGEGGDCTLTGLYVVNGRQHVDNHTVIDHAMPHCGSHELYKGVLDDHATGVFSGKIIVRKDAQKTDAKQTNQNLLLSSDAVVDTRPQLEILADDVRCTHGATIGQLEEEAVFYLRSRGLALEDARALLTHAFAGDIIRRIEVSALRERLETRLFGGTEMLAAEPRDARTAEDPTREAVGIAL